MERTGEGHLPAYEGRGPSLDAAITNAAESAMVEGETWFEVSRIQTEVLPHNQWVRTYRVVITPSG